MLLLRKSSALEACLEKARQEGKSIGFVPTMGALHAGHLALVNTCKDSNALTVVSIFVNPAQFNDKKDFEKYPVTIEKDIEGLVGAGCDVLFYPSVEEVYPPTAPPPHHYNLGFLETVFEGQYRPGHFQGVCRVMERLLQLVRPANLYMGQKDYQQCMVVQRLISLMHAETRLVVCETLREPDGLAMSSRNTRLNSTERQNATAISGALRYIKQNISATNTDQMMAEAMQLLNQHDFKMDYLSLADARTLEPVKSWDGKQHLVALAAGFQHEVRLIDNLVLN